MGGEGLHILRAEAVEVAKKAVMVIWWRIGAYLIDKIPDIAKNKDSFPL